MAIREPLHTTTDFEVFINRPENANRRFELIEGQIVEKMPTQEHGIIAGAIITAINVWQKPNRIGRAAVEARYRAPGDIHNDRIPDVSFIADLSIPVVREGVVDRLPDLAVEIKSPSDTFQSMTESARYYLANGVRMVWLIYPKQKLIEVLTVNDRQLLTIEDKLDGGTVLPGFRIAVSEIFEE
jgi:Uma2 family endonuclease